MSVIDRLNSSNGTSSATDPKGKRQGKKQAKREAKLLLKVEQARKDVAKAEGKVSKVQAKLDDSRKQLQNLEEKLAAFRAPQQQTNNHGSTQEQEQNPQDTPAPNSIMAEQQGQQEEQGQPEGQGGAGEQLPLDETYVDGAVDTERASTPYSAISDILQSEKQEQYESDAAAQDVEQAEDQGVVSTPPDNQHQESNPEQSQAQGQHSNTFFESRSDDDIESAQDAGATHQADQSATSSDAEEQHSTPEPSDSPGQHNPTTNDE